MPNNNIAIYLVSVLVPAPLGEHNMRIPTFSILLYIFSWSAPYAEENTDTGFLLGATPTVSSVRAAKVIADYFGHIEKAPLFKTRGVGGASLYATWAPSVVLIITDDGIGSGSIISDDGLILTNWHVVEENKEVLIAFMPKGLGAEVSEVDVVSADVIHLARDKDLALVKITVTDRKLPKPFGFGSLDDIQIGLDTHAIGHPNGEFWTYTRGYVSQFRLNYEWSYSETEKFNATVIQTQTPINPGNSGGPLINAAGKIIGVNSFQGEGQAINFAVALDEINAFINAMPDVSAVKKADECEAEVLNNFRSKNNDGEVILADRDCNGVADIAVYTPDDRSQTRIVDYDENEDGEIDGTSYDKGVDDYWEGSIWDTDFDGEFDMEGVHEDGALNPSSYREYRT